MKLKQSLASAVLELLAVLLLTALAFAWGQAGRAGADGYTLRGLLRRLNNRRLHSRAPQSTRRTRAAWTSFPPPSRTPCWPPGSCTPSLTAPGPSPSGRRVPWWLGAWWGTTSRGTVKLCIIGAEPDADRLTSYSCRVYLARVVSAILSVLV